MKLRNAEIFVPAIEPQDWHLMFRDSYGRPPNVGRQFSK